MTDEPKPRTARKPRASSISTAERAAILAASASGVSGHKLAALTGRHRDTIAKILSGPEAQLAKDLAQSILVSGATTFARDWQRASKQAAEKGNHVPALEALERVGVVKPPDRTPHGGGGFHDTIGIALPGLGTSQAGPHVIELPTADDAEIIDAE